MFLGSERFAVEQTRDIGRMEEVPRRHWQPYRRPLAALLAGRSDADVARAYSAEGYTMREIADYLGVHYATISRRLRRHEGAMSDCKT